MKHLVLSFLFLSAQALVAQNPIPVSPTPVAGASVATTNSTAAKEYLTSTAVDAEIRDLKPGDVFQFVIEEDPSRASSPMSIKVSDGGEAMFPVAQNNAQYVKVNVRGKKIADIRREVKDLLDADYYNNCTVRLDLNLINRTGAGLETLGKVVIYGEMQGVVQLTDGEIKRISDAIISLGRSQFADLRRVRLHRADPATGKTDIKIINVDKILRDGNRDEDIALQDGDRIEVRPRTFNF